MDLLILARHIGILPRPEISSGTRAPFAQGRLGKGDDAPPRSAMGDSPATSERMRECTPHAAKLPSSIHSCSLRPEAARKDADAGKKYTKGERKIT